MAISELWEEYWILAEGSSNVESVSVIAPESLLKRKYLHRGRSPRFVLRRQWKAETESALKGQTFFFG